MQSLRISPSKPSVSRKRPCRIARDIVAGTPPGSMLGKRMWLLIMAGTPAPIAARNGISSHDSSCASVFSMRGRPMCESTAVSPWPGKCLPQQRIPPFRYPSTAFAPKSAARFGSSPKLRTPITGFMGLEFTSRSGARLKFTPTPRSCRAVISAARAAFSGFPVAARAMLPGTFTASHGRRVTMPPS